MTVINYYCYKISFSCHNILTEDVHSQRRAESRALQCHSASLFTSPLLSVYVSRSEELDANDSFQRSLHLPPGKRKKTPSITPLKAQSQQSLLHVPITHA